jgi:hypothetical protein
MMRRTSFFKAFKSSFGWMPSKEELISRHEGARKSPEWKNFKRSGPAWGGCADEDGNPLPSPNFAELEEIDISSLRLDGNTQKGKSFGHQGRVLTGQLIVDPLQAPAVNTLLEDRKGDVVRLFVYEAAAEELPKGARISIAVPLFKIMLDGWPGVRCDYPGGYIAFHTYHQTPVETAPGGITFGPAKVRPKS